jgi:hypothetical protein
MRWVLEGFLYVICTACILLFMYAVWVGLNLVL